MHKNGNLGLGFPCTKWYINIKQEKWFLGNDFGCVTSVLSKEIKTSFKNRGKLCGMTNSMCIKGINKAENQK